MKNYCTLTEEENEVKDLILQGLNNRKIAKILIISVHASKAYVCNIIQKLGIKNRLGVFINEIQLLQSLTQ